MNRLLPYLQLVRLPNVFTAWADILLAALVTGALVSLGHWPAFLLLLLSSSCLYCSGMVWNDYFDIEQDERERPFRPLPSGRIKLHTASMLGTALMAAGVFFAVLADFRGGGFRWHSTLIAVFLAISILLYNGALKTTWAGPIAMGACRFFNVLLGLSIVAWQPWGLILAMVVGVYIAGVTWFARTEASESNRTMLIGATIVMALALVLALTLPAVGPVAVDEDSNLPKSHLVWLGQLLFPYLLVAFAAVIGIPLWTAIKHPNPTKVQPAVKRCIFGLALLDGILATAFVGPFGLLLVLVLLPAIYLGKWLYST